MTDCTEQQLPGARNGIAREGQKGMPKGGHSMTDCTEQQLPGARNGIAREGQKGMPKEDTA
jgi:hypothetical protein